MSNFTFRAKQTETEAGAREQSLQQELEFLSNSENRLRYRCDELEDSLAKTIREKDRCLLELQGLESRAQALEKQLNVVEDEKADLEFRLSSLNSALRRGLGMSNRRRKKMLIPLRSSSPDKLPKEDEDDIQYGKFLYLSNLQLKIAFTQV